MEEKEKKTLSVQAILAIAAIAFWFLGLSFVSGVFAGAAGALFFGKEKIAEWIGGAKKKGEEFMNKTV